MAKGRKLVASTYNLPEVCTLPEQHVSKEHADLNLKDFLKSLVHLINTCPQLRKHMHWFYDVQRGCPKVNHLKKKFFFMGFRCLSSRKETALCSASHFYILLGSFKFQSTLGYCVSLLTLKQAHVFGYFWKLLKMKC